MTRRSGRGLDRPGVESGHDLDRGPGEQRSRDDGEPADVGEGQAGQPCVMRRVDRQPVAGGPRGRSDGVVGEHHAAGPPAVPEVATTRASPSTTGSPPARVRTAPSGSTIRAVARAARSASWRPLGAAGGRAGRRRRPPPTLAAAPRQTPSHQGGRVQRALAPASSVGRRADRDHRTTQRPARRAPPAPAAAVGATR